MPKNTQPVNGDDESSSESTESVSVGVLGHITDDLISDMPQVSDNAIAEHEEQERKFNANDETPAANASPVSGSAPTDKNGKAYDPNTHEISPLTGKAIKKRRGGKSGSTSSSVVVNSQTSKSSQISTVDKSVVEARATGKFAASAMIGLCVGVFGDEFNPQKTDTYDERGYLENAFGDYFVATGRTDLPPSMALVVAIGVYVAPRFTQPKTQTKLGAIKDWAISKYFGWRAKKDLKKQNLAEAE